MPTADVGLHRVETAIALSPYNQADAGPIRSFAMKLPVVRSLFAIGLMLAGARSASADMIAYGVSSGGSVFAIDATAHTSASIANTGLGANVNGVAIDPTTGAGGTLLYSNTSSAGSLYAFDLASHIQTAFTYASGVTALPGSISDGAFNAGSFYYIENSSKTLVKVSLNETTHKITGFTTSAINGAPTLSFGDIAISGNTLYGSSAAGIFSVDLTTDAYTLIKATSTLYQIAINAPSLGGGLLATSAGAWSTIDTTTGVATGISGFTTPVMNDLSDTLVSGVAVPEPSGLALSLIGTACAIGYCSRRRLRLVTI
jgi:hypothetical protein